MHFFLIWCVLDIASIPVRWSSGGFRERIRILKRRNRFSIWQPWEDATETAVTLPIKQQQLQQQTGNKKVSF
jgi:hypothetical protein